MSLAALALVLWAVYGFVAIVVRVAIHLRRTGDSGLLRARKGPSELGAGLAIALGVAAPVLAIADVLDPIGALDGTAGHVAGVALYSAGLALIVLAQETMGASWRVGVNPEERTELVARGPFALARNPIFTALIVIQAGLCLLVPSVVALAGLALLWLSIQAQVRRVEEPYLLAAHGFRRVATAVDHRRHVLDLHTSHHRYPFPKFRDDAYPFPWTLYERNGPGRAAGRCARVRASPYPRAHESL
jgi:protein-S-isoprenylcysteine O-methyltransferase Ste14